MPFNGSGLFTRLYTWATEALSPPIALSKLDEQEEEFAAAFSNCLTRDGQGKPAANLDWNDKKITNLADATADKDALNRQSADARYYAVTGSFTGTVGEGTVSTATGTVKYSISDGIATLWIEANIMISASGSTTLNMTGMPVGARPAAVRTVLCGKLKTASPSGADAVGGCNIATNGTINFFTGDGNTSGFNNFANPKGLATGWCISYPV